MTEIKEGGFYLDGKPLKIYSGAMHYFRIPEEYWEDRLLKLRAAGLNTVETYVAWNLHEPAKGTFDFSGMLDIRKFLRTAQELGLYAIVRPGPFICAEWDTGGFPGWLLADRNMRLRCSDAVYLSHVADWYRRLFAEIEGAQIGRGGNVIAMQIENEYGSYGNDKSYLRSVEKIMRDCGAETFLFTADGAGCYFLSGGKLPDVYAALTFGSHADTAFDCLAGQQDGAPKTCMEFWDGWFDHWGEEHHVRPKEECLSEVRTFLDTGCNFNLYMFHGGTNFGFTAGANKDADYMPTVTSYDYGAPLGEYGNYTPLYMGIREMMLDARGISPQSLPLPPAPETQEIGRVELTEFASLRGNLEGISRVKFSPAPCALDDFGMTSGYVWYKAEVEGRYADFNLYFSDVHDRAYVYLDGEQAGILWRNDAGKGKDVPPRMHGIFHPALNGKMTVEVLVDAMGGINYGYEIGERKGLGDVMLERQYLFNWECRAIETDDLSALVYDGIKEVPCFMRGKFRAERKDCFVRLDGFRKGFVSVNGKNLGRYWEIGPQKTLYLPGCWLHEGENEIIVFEQEGYRNPTVEITDTPDLG